MSQARLEVQGLEKSYSGTLVLEGIDLSLAPGKTLALMGRSGSGKSTLLRCIAMLDEPDRGSLLLDGQLYASGREQFFEPWEVRRQIVLVLQDFSLFESMTLLENISLALITAKGLGRRAAHQRAEAMAATLGIEHLLRRYPTSLSGGETQRGALARAMVLEPKVLLLDEITSALDPETVRDVTAALRTVKGIDSAHQAAIVAVTHLPRFAEDFADEIAFLHGGKIHEQLPADRFFRECKKPETRKFSQSVTRVLS